MAGILFAFYSSLTRPEIQGYWYSLCISGFFFFFYERSLMLFSPKQDSALKQVNEWLKNGKEQVFHLFGYAGTGKTTLAKYLAEGVDGNVIFAAFTGKAAYVLKTKGCPAQTIHSLIYHSRDKGKKKLEELEKDLQDLINQLTEWNEDHTVNKKVIELNDMIHKEREGLKQPFFILNQDSEIRKAKLVVIDECSMVDAKMGEDLLSFGVKVLVLGDPAQLPPIMGAGYFTENVKPNIMLDEIHRQAQESPIIRMATDVRNEKVLNLGDYGNDCRVISNDIRLEPEEVLKFNQILVGRNATRFTVNSRVRVLNKFEDPYPVVGDKLVCLRNDHNAGLLNGAIYTVSSIAGIMDEKVVMDILPENGDFTQEVVAHEQHFLGKGNEIAFYEKKDAQEFDYGYALTVHKAQGSQWDNVLLFDESSCFKKDRWRWLYTGITRAAEKLTILRT